MTEKPVIEPSQTPIITQVDALDGETIIATGVRYADYLQRYGEKRCEWVMGSVIETMPDNTRHQMVLLFLSTLLHLYVSQKQLGDVLLAGVSMFINDKMPAREPDILVVLAAHRDRIRETHLQGAADIAVEIVSPESERRDYGDKFIEYAVAGVPEYWLIDPLRDEAFIYTLADDNRYRLAVHNGLLRSQMLPGFRLEADTLWQNPLPDARRQIALVQAMLDD